MRLFYEHRATKLTTGSGGKGGSLRSYPVRCGSRWWQGCSKEDRIERFIAQHHQVLPAIATDKEGRERRDPASQAIFDHVDLVAGAAFDNTALGNSEG